MEFKLLIYKCNFHVFLLIYVCKLHWITCISPELLVVRASNLLDDILASEEVFKHFNKRLLGATDRKGRELSESLQGPAFHRQNMNSRSDFNPELSQLNQDFLFPQGVCASITLQRQKKWGRQSCYSPEKQSNTFLPCTWFRLSVLVHILPARCREWTGMFITVIYVLSSLQHFQFQASFLYI